MRTTILITSLLTLGLLTGCTANQSKDVTTQAPKTETTTNQALQKPKITLEKAGALYQKQYPNSDLTEVELKQFGRHTFYELTGMSDNEELHMHVDANNGTVSQLGKETLDTDEQNGRERQQKRLIFDQLISVKQAMQKAQRYFSGTIVKWSLEKDDGRAIWEINGKHKRQIMQVKLDAETGALIEKEIDD
ncbi:PepSY domain-containing protein [Latilactobacillus graminis]|uniref:Peptidase propeptide and YPEB domain protein n=2 Tax=Latilactobacillus graminis TaxID=60519 RepID=A0AA89L505_9LACO|nr:PepSY domain-containing protein [Latilactobacillus graminis]KRM23763.1 peptidase propeptide and YPEB domain protein [Latilactobacillus graminis DSM 20719]QFP80145.1 hypothetical protein LG542_07925 [Latilactobacillus graminis]